MTFALSGSLITQSGTDNDATTISGISAIAGVTTIAESGRTRLFIPFRLQIAGTMTNTSAAAFTFSRNASPPQNEVVVTATGRWNYKEARTVNGLTDWRIMPPMIFTQAPNNSYNGTGNNLIFLQGGTLDFAKLEIIGNGGQYWSGGTVIYRDVIINAEGLAAANDCQITTQDGNPTLDIDGLEIRGASMFLKDAVITQLKRLKPKFVSRGFGNGFGLNKTLQDFDSTGAVFDLAIYGGGSTRLNNPVKGGAVTVGPWNSPNNVNNENYCTADLQLTGINEAGAAVLFKAYHRDNNTGAPAGAGTTATNYTLRKTYNVLSSGAGVATLNVLIAASMNDAPMVRRSVSKVDDFYAFACFSYLSQPAVTTPINLAGAGIKSATVVQLKDPSVTELVKAAVDAYTALDTLDRLYDRAKAYLFDNFAGETAAFFAVNGSALDASNRNIVIDGAAASAFAFDAATNTITIKAAVLSGGTKFTGLTTTGTVTLIPGSTLTNVSIMANVFQATPTNFTGVTITGTLTYNAAAATPVTYTNSNTGNVANIGAGVVTVKRINSTLTAGPNVVAYAPTVLALALNGGRIRITDNAGAEQFNQTADGSFELPAAATGVWNCRIAKYGSNQITGSFAVDGTTKAIAASYIPDLNVVDSQANAAFYTDLETAQKLYDHLAHFATTAGGIANGVLAAKGFGTLTVAAGLTLNPTATNVVAVAAGVVTAKTSGLNEAVTLISSGVINTGAAVLSDNVQMRASNLDSELSYTANELKFYPTQADRDAGTNIGQTITGGLFRFKAGTVVSGVTLAGTSYLRATVGSTTFFADILLVAGKNTLDLGVQAQLNKISSEIKLSSSGVIANIWGAAK